MVEELLARRGMDAAECQREKTSEQIRWMLQLGEHEELEVLIEGLRKPSETTIYMGVNIVTVPIRGAYDLLTAALEIADGLVGIKVSLVGHYLVLSASLSAVGISVDDLEYHLRLIEAQQVWFRDALAAELQWDEFPLE